jgi:hypothetical protein
MQKRARIRLTDDDAPTQQDRSPPRLCKRYDDADDVPSMKTGNREPEQFDPADGTLRRIGGPGLDRDRFLQIRNNGGRPRGVQNRVTVALKQAIILGAEDVGEDGKGKDGLQGYMRRLALQEPSVFGQLLRRIMPVEVRRDIDPNSTLGQVLEAVRARIAYEKAKAIDGTWKR